MLGKAGTRKVRDPERTRERLLQAAFREVRRTGFRSAGINTILADTNVTKGALYHHFDSKEALGYAIVDESSQNLSATGGCVLCFVTGNPSTY